MNQFGLIIHETTAGSNLQFVSSHLDVNSPEIKETITDERTLASQLANMSDVYAVQITKKYKVYSLIVTNHTDFLGRSGFYAIRLYGPKGLNLNNFEKNLSDIKDRYIADTTSNNLNNQNYDDILSSILIVENDRKDFISLKNNVNCFYYFDNNTSTLSTVFNTKGIHLVHKVYAFNKIKAVPENLAVSSGLKSYSLINTSQKEINIVNSYSILKELKINNQNVDFNPNVSDFNLICQTNDSVLYNTTDDKTLRQIANNFISIERKYVPRPEPRRTSTFDGNKKTFWEENGIYLGILLLTIMMAGGSWWFFERENNPPIVIENGVTEPLVDIQHDTISLITFELDGKIEDSTYLTNFPKLEKYRFKFAKGKWKYNKDNQSDQDFYVEEIKKIIKNNHLNLTEIDFKNKLESISKRIITKKKISHKNNNDSNQSAANSKSSNENKAINKKATVDLIDVKTKADDTKNTLSKQVN
jgi:hypothetical protein